MENDNSILLLTYDYEMYLGKSGSIEKCLLEPTDSLLTIFKKNGSSVTFFVDTTFLLTLKKNGNKNDFDCISNQLKRIIEDGHRIELHIHPHWIDAQYDQKNKEWIFPTYRYYKHENVPIEILKNLFIEGAEILLKIGKSVDSNYQLIAFRAGGWCLEPFEKIRNLLIECGIKVDSSVLPGFKNNHLIANYDYSNIFTSKPYYFDYSIYENKSKGSFLEIPISVTSVNFIQRFKRKIEIRSNPKMSECIGDGKSIFETIKIRKNEILKNYLEKLRTHNDVVSLDGYINDNSFTNLNNENKLITAVGHPKSQTKQSLLITDKISRDQRFKCITIYDFFSHYNAKE